MILTLVSLASASGALVCLIVSLILLFIAAFVGTPLSAPEAPLYRRLSFGWAGVFFYVLAVALA